MRIIADEKQIIQYCKKHHLDTFFSNLDVYLPGFRLITLEKGNFLYQTEESRKFFFFLVEGKFSIYTTNEEGERLLVRHCDSFIGLGDMELLGFSEPENAIEMDTKATFLALDVSLYRNALLSDLKFMNYIARGLAEKLNYFARMQMHDKSLTPRQRIISHIIATAGQSLYYKENLRKTSQVLSISYRHFHRILSELVLEGLLVRKSGGYQIVNISKLESAYFACGK